MFLLRIVLGEFQPLIMHSELVNQKHASDLANVVSALLSPYF